MYVRNSNLILLLTEIDTGFRGPCFLPIRVLLTFSFISFLLAFVENPRAHLLEQKRPDP